LSALPPGVPVRGAMNTTRPESFMAYSRRIAVKSPPNAPVTSGSACAWRASSVRVPSFPARTR
jgi:hypothetical protein